MKLNPTAASLLGFLEDGAQTGYDLAQTAAEIIGPFWSLTRSQVYRELTALAEAGLIQAGDRGARSRQPYTITPAGHEAFVDWISQPLPAEQIRIPLLLVISFGRWLEPGQILALLADHRRDHQARLDAYQAMGPLDDPYQAAVLSFGTHYEQAVLDWIDHIPLAPAP